MKLEQVVKQLDYILKPENFSDAALNGLQVESSAEVKRIVAAVDISLELASHEDCSPGDLLLVHHGFFWGKPLPVRGSHKDTLIKLLERNLSVYASHLPLDAHPKVGNNALLAAELGLLATEPCGLYAGSLIGSRGENTKGVTFSEMVTRSKNLPGARNVVDLNFGPKVPEKVLVVTGAAADMLREYSSLDFDTLVTGEPRQFAYHYAKEKKLNVLFAGHYASETLGVRKVSELVSQELGLASSFIDIPTGI